MFLSQLLINASGDPDHPTPGREWLANRYRMHQRLCMAFPTQERFTRDREFLEPYVPADFPEDRSGADQSKESSDTAVLAHVHRPRDPSTGFLFRVESGPAGEVAVWVLSAAKPDWNYAFQNSPGLLATAPRVPRPVELRYHPGTHCRFRLTANPVRRLSKNSKNAAGEAVTSSWIGKRAPVPLNEAHLRAWLENRAEPQWDSRRNKTGATPGFQLLSIESIDTGSVRFNKTRSPKNSQRLVMAEYQGTIVVTDTESFRKTIITGIGPAKAFGFGLLSVVPVQANSTA